MENPNEGNNMPKNDWLNANERNDDDTLMPGTAGNISSPTGESTGSQYNAADRQDDPGNAGQNSTDDEDADDIEEDEDTEQDDSIHKSDWGDVDPQHDGTSSNEPSFPGSAI